MNAWGDKGSTDRNDRWVWLLILVSILLINHAYGQQHTTTVQSKDGTITQITSSCSNGNCSVEERDITDEVTDRQLFREKVMYCTRGLKMPKKEVVLKGQKWAVSSECDDAYEKSLTEGVLPGDCSSIGKGFNYSTRQCAPGRWDRY